MVNKNEITSMKAQKQIVMYILAKAEIKNLKTLKSLSKLQQLETYIVTIVLNTIAKL